MRAWIWTLIVFVAAVALALVLQDHRGNVVLNVPPWQISVSITFAVLAILAFCFIVYWVLRFLGWVTGAPERYRVWRRHRAQQRDQQLLQRGWLALLDGRYHLAEKELIKLHSKSKSKKTKLIAALTAARVLQQQNNFAGRDDYLQKAQRLIGHDNQLKVAYATAAAELYIRNNEPEQAVELLQPIQDATTRHFHATRLLLRAQYMLQRYQQVYDLTRILVRRSAMEQSEALHYLDVAVVYLIYQANELQFKNLWADLRGDERVRPEIALAAASKWAEFNNQAEVARVLEAALNVQLDPILLSKYGQVDEAHYAHRLSKAEEWLKREPDNADLLALLGQLCFKGQLWGQAEHYLKKSMSLRDDMRIHALLGTLYNATGKVDKAMRHWQLAAEVAGTLPSVNQRVLLPAADTQSDPTYAGMAAYAHLDSQSMKKKTQAKTKQEPMAASAANEQLDTYHSSGKKTSVAKKAAKSSPLQQYNVAESDDDPHQYFDTAPIPGLRDSIKENNLTKEK